MIIIGILIDKFETPGELLGEAREGSYIYV